MLSEPSDKYFKNGHFWKAPCAPAVPQVVIQTIPHDGKGNILLMHRTDKVRSAPNVWSFPSGLHDIGETLAAGSARELLEEYNLTQDDFAVLGVYENIAGDAAGEQYHWTIIMAAAQCDLTKVVNKEPDKHDMFEIVPARNLEDDRFMQAHPFHPSLTDWLFNNARQIIEAAHFELYR